jgi:hypothetical protein
LPFTLLIPDAVTADVATGFVVLQVRVTLQLLAPDAIVQEEFAGVRVPVIGLFSEQNAVPPPFEPTQLQVYELVPFTLLELVPELQL